LLSGRVPNHVQAIVMRANPGEGLTCRAKEHNFGDGIGPRGIVSYYATEAIGAAADMADWLARIRTHVERDIRGGRLSPIRQPDLQLIGHTP
jgi:hypothetical protein